ncbi:MAG: hypothetical protein EB141_05910 [Verrucomicrobia bacterium]|nr:hypothetical protein [Verrucomicrobiota bacterium]NBU08438.1 hypothetical protein [Pseudomonadota bacterium]NDA65565.1 hypothetical protein [Verrucomicrobiota bacterium]NDB75167.1 hypothetical protein [Verrucomicrobiota bacterium]NDD37462.1 hypothetical protein [Verrucomicrobiota bacterium]
MKWALITANILAAAAFIYLGAMAMAAHKTHAYSMYREFYHKGVLNEPANYSVEKRMQEIAAGGDYYTAFSVLGVSMCLVHAIAIAVWHPNRPAASPETRTPHS